MKRNLFCRHSDADSMQMLKSVDFRFELAMSGYIIDNPCVLQLNNDDLSSPVILSAELPFDKKTRTDLIAGYRDKNGNPAVVAVVELKNVEIEKKHLDQLLGYLDTLASLKTAPIPWLDGRLPIIGVIAGPSFRKDVIDTIVTGKGLDGKVVYGIELNRYQLDGRLLAMTEVYEKKTGNSNDTYTLVDLQMKEHTFSKRRLVLKAIESYVMAHPDISVADLQSVFPKSLGGWGTNDQKEVVIEEALVNPAIRNKRYQTDTIIVDGKKVCVSGEWGSMNFDNIVQKLQSLGFSIY